PARAAGVPAVEAVMIAIGVAHGGGFLPLSAARPVVRRRAPARAALPRHAARARRRGAACSEAPRIASDTRARLAGGQDRRHRQVLLHGGLPPGRVIGRVTRSCSLTVLVPHAAP